MEKPKAREKVLAMREQQEKEAKIRKFIKIGIAGLLAVCVVIVGVLIYNNVPAGTFEPSSKEVPNGITPAGSFMVDGDGAVAPPEARKDTDKTRVQMMFDPMCPGCGAVDRALNERILELAKNGEINLQVTPLSFLDRTSSDNYSTRASNAATTIATGSPEHFYAFVTTLFEEGNQPEEGGAYVPVTNEDLVKMAESVGVSPEVAATIKDEKYNDWVLSNTNFNMARKDLFPADDFSTPVIFIGGSETEDGVVKDAVRVDWSQPRTIEEAFEETYSQVTGE